MKLQFHRYPRATDALTNAQEETYWELKISLWMGERLTVQAVTERLGLKNPRSLRSRIDHLCEKGLLSYS